MKKWILSIVLQLVMSSVYAMPEVILVEQKKQTATIQYDGHLFSTHLIEVQSPANATLVKSHVNLGDKVKQNQLLFEFISPELQLQLSEAKMAVLESQDALLKLKNWSTSYEALQALANLEKAQNENVRIKTRFAQTKALYDKGIIAKEECLLEERLYKDSQQYVQSAQRQLAQTKDKASQAALQLAALQLQQAESKKALLQQKVDQLIIRSPIDGTLLAPKAADNKQIMPFYPMRVYQGQEILAWVADLSQLCITVKVDEFDIVRLHKDQPAIISFAAFSQYKLQGKIAEITQSHFSASAAHEVMTYDVKVALNEIPPQLQGKLLMGMSAKVALEESMPQGLWIAKVAVHFENDEPYVLKMNEQKSIKQPVVLGDNAKNEVLVLSGLVAGDQIVVHG